jgi:hypothetical protein
VPLASVPERLGARSGASEALDRRLRRALGTLPPFATLADSRRLAARGEEGVRGQALVGELEREADH